jgi:hypothetical protein
MNTLGSRTNAVVLISRLPRMAMGVTSSSYSPTSQLIQCSDGHEEEKKATHQNVFPFSLHDLDSPRQMLI